MNIRKKQSRLAIFVNVLSSMGTTVFLNMGLFAILIILMIDWAQGRKLETDVVISTMALVYFVFMAVNVIFYFALTNCYNFLVVLFRLSQIFEMEEHLDQRKMLTYDDKGHQITDKGP